MRLVIAEKPSVAADLAKVMDPGARRAQGQIAGRYATWTWALGHMAELLPPEAYRPELQGRWRLDLLPVLPERHGLRPREGREEQWETIRRLVGEADEVIVATDAGREGELIWAYIAELCDWQGPTRRLWLSEGTPAAVRAAFEALREPMTNLAQAARARAQADWVVGMNATMALSARHGGLWSTGRVQTPTLALLCGREAEIRAFRPDDYFAVLAAFEAAGGSRYSGRWFQDKEDRIPGKDAAEAIAAKVREQIGRIARVERKETREQPPRLFNLTDLQRAANARYGLTAAASLKAAQALYEQHKALTYPRTDSRHVSSDTFATFRSRLKAVRGELAPVAARLAEDLPDPGKRVVDDSQVSDHHALLPTAQAPDPARLAPDEAKVYDLVVRRFLAALLPAALYADTEVITEVVGETFRSRARALMVPGWRECEPPTAASKTRSRRSADGADGDEHADDSELDTGDIAALFEGPVRCLQAKAEARQTKPPARYSEATLLRAMEHAGRLIDDEELADIMKDRGLGTPATRAAIIETLIKREYVRRDKKALVPTPRGEQLVAMAPQELRQPETTGEWEQRLRAIEGGHEEAQAFLAGITDLTKRIVADIAAQRRAAPAPSASETVGACPRCGGHVIDRKQGFFCANGRPEAGACRWVMWRRIAGKDLTAGQARELLATGATKRAVRGFKSQAGKAFEARLHLDRDSGRVSFVFDRPDPGAPVAPRSPATPQPTLPGAARKRSPAGAQAPAASASAAKRSPAGAQAPTAPASAGKRSPAGAQAPTTPASAGKRSPAGAQAPTAPASAGKRSPAGAQAPAAPASAAKRSPAGAQAPTAPASAAKRVQSSSQPPVGHPSVARRSTTPQPRPGAPLPPATVPATRASRVDARRPSDRNDPDRANPGKTVLDTPSRSG